MANPFAKQAQSSSKSKFKAMTGKSGGGQKHSDEAQDKKLFNKMFSEKKAEGSIPGKASGGRLDAFARGGRAKAKGSTVNIAIVVPGKSGEQPAPGVPPLPPPVAGPGGGPGPIADGPANPPGPPIMPPGSGGGAKPVLRKSGGSVKMTGGAYGGLGRLQKAKNAKAARG